MSKCPTPYHCKIKDDCLFNCDQPTKKDLLIEAARDIICYIPNGDKKETLMKAIDECR